MAASTAHANAAPPELYGWLNDPGWRESRLVHGYCGRGIVGCSPVVRCLYKARVDTAVSAVYISLVAVEPQKMQTQLCRRAG